jgi:hypothetical protein
MSRTQRFDLGMGIVFLVTVILALYILVNYVGVLTFGRVYSIAMSVEAVLGLSVIIGFLYKSEFSLINLFSPITMLIIWVIIDLLDYFTHPSSEFLIIASILIVAQIISLLLQILLHQKVNY